MTENILIRRAAISDIEALQKIARQTSIETFLSDSNGDNMKKYLDEAFSYDKLTEEISNPESEFYFAVSENTVIGFLKVNYGKAQKEPLEDEAFEIERIYVTREYHGKKIGQMLFDKAIDIARNRKAKYVWLGVWEFNHRAMRFYKKNGFIKFGEHKFIFGDDEETDLLMKLDLTNK